MEAADAWRAVFENWPEAIPHEGLIATKGQETIPFVNFMVSGGILLVERDKPDSTGARKVMLSYEQIAAVKITSTLELARFQVMGFQPPM